MKKLVLTAFLIMAASPAYALQGYYTQGPDQMAELTPPISDIIYDYNLAANTSQAVAWPNNTNYVNFTCPSPFWVSGNSSIIVPASNITDGTGASLNPGQRKRNSQQNTFYMISATAQECSVEFWGGQ